MKVEHYGLGIDLDALRAELEDAHAEADRLRDMLAKYGRQEFLEHRAAFEAGYEAAFDAYCETERNAEQWDRETRSAWKKYYKGAL